MYIFVQSTFKNKTTKLGSLEITLGNSATEVCEGSECQFRLLRTNSLHPLWVSFPLRVNDPQQARSYFIANTLSILIVHAFVHDCSSPALAKHIFLNTFSCPDSYPQLNLSPTTFLNSASTSSCYGHWAPTLFASLRLLVTPAWLLQQRLMLFIPGFICTLELNKLANISNEKPAFNDWERKLKIKERQKPGKNLGMLELQNPWLKELNSADENPRLQ